MASILNSAVILGDETTYGTPASTFDRAFEAQADTFKKSVEYLETESLRGNFQTQRDTRRKLINMGAEGTIAMDVTEQGMGYVFQGMFGTKAQAQIGATDAYTETYSTDVDESAVSYSVQVQRADVGATLRSFTYHGCVITGWSLTQNVGELLNIELNFDSEDVDTSTGAVGSPESLYPGGVPFDWTQAAVTWQGVSLGNVMDFSLTGDLGLKTDRRFLRGSELKKRPLRASVPSYEGTMTVEFEDLDLYSEFVAGTVDELVITWTSANEIPTSSGEFYSLTVTLPAAQFSGDTPEVNFGDTPKQSVPFKVLHNGTDDAITFEYVTVDDSSVITF